MAIQLLKSKSKKAFMDISFSWIFAILIGGFILFGAVYGVSKFTEIKQTSRSAESTVQFSNLLNPLETGVESAKFSSIIFPVETKIKNSCDEDGDFGKQVLSTQEKVRGKWTKYGINVSFKNKYLFSTNAQGKKFYIFSKPFEYPFKIANLMYITSSEENYCFIDAPKKIKKELNESGQSNIYFDCDNLENPVNVCFRTNSDCDVLVNQNQKYVKKSGEKLYYDTDALMYAAIFSEKDLYECQVTRLMKRTNLLLDIYGAKASLGDLDCSKNLVLDLVNGSTSLKSSIESYSSSQDLVSLSTQVNLIQRKNKNLRCRLW